jgi:putative acetyltransferase
VLRLLHEHLRDMAATSPARSRHALDPAGLAAPGVTFWTVCHGPELLGCGAVKDLGEGHGEVKTMRIRAEHRGRGVADATVDFLVQQARDRGWARLSLETGSQDFFVPARRLYARHGFTVTGPFGAYVEDPNCVFMTRAL